VRQRLLELGIRGRLLAADLPATVFSRARSARGQTTVEWLAILVGFVTLVTVLAGNDIWRQAGEAIVHVVDGILGSDSDSV
jgi:hypothetical protein